MFEEFDARSQTKIVRDADGIARALSHANRYVATEAPTPQLAARNYLSRYGELLGLRREQLTHLFLPTEREPTADEIEYRFVSEKHQFDLTTVALYQTCFGLPIWEAGLSITMKDNPLRVVGAQSTLHPDVEVKRPSAEIVVRLKTLDVETLANSLGLAGKALGDAPLSIDSQRFMIYRYDKARRTDREAGPPDEPAFEGGGPALPLPPVDSSIRDGRHYVVLAVYFRFDVTPFRPLHWVALMEVETLSVLLLRPFVDSVSGLVFEADPVTLAGGPTANTNSSALNPLRSSVTLAGLAAPASGTQQALGGSSVTLSDVETPIVLPPTEPVGTNFDFCARTNDFAAVNAYYHCDRAFRVVEDLGFSIPGYFPGTTFPIAVDHRGHFSPSRPQGDEINAHCAGTAGGTGILYASFSLADISDLANPIGMACDWRTVMHELFGHGILFNHIGGPRFNFSHSAGDSFAAILSDPGSQAPDRFDTFPWWQPGIPAALRRRHDRAAAAGFGWSGDIALHPFDNGKDRNGYNNEQILSTTMFRVYRSIGGDSADLATKRFAARFTCHIMLAAIQSLTPATSPRDAACFAEALTEADLGDWPSEGHAGGAYNKVIRWAFEKQGLYQPAGTPTPNNNEGAPPPVDVYIEDGRGGEYQYQSNHWSCQAIWNRRHNDGGTSHEEPVVGVTNYAHVKIKNRGSQTATNVVVRAFHCQPSAGLVYPDDWQPMTTSQLAAANVPPNSAAEIIVGPFDWVPSQVGHECMLMVASADGDASNIDNFTAADSIPDWRLVPNDNNIGQRNVYPVAGATGNGLLEEFDGLSFQLKNPFNRRARMSVKATLPPFLDERGWRIAFGNAGADTFALEPGGRRDVVMRLLPGRNFNAADVRKAKDPIIEIEAFADGILVGGMSYPVEHEAKKPARPKRRSHGRAKSRTLTKARSRTAVTKTRHRVARG
jgi:zinc metalloprotease ZmpB